MDFLVKLISALAQILWPILGFTALFAFRKQIAEILPRLKKGKMLGQEFELTDSLEKLRASAETAKETVTSLPVPDSQPIVETLEKVEHDEIKQILDEASRSPRVALITLSGYIEIAAKKALASVGLLQRNQEFSTTEAMDRLNRQYGGIQGDIVGSTKLFMNVRNKIIHTREASEDDVISALDSGLTILRTLKSLQSETHSVLHSEVPVYSNPECTVERTDVKGVILESVSPGGLRKSKHIFPSTSKDFKKGQIVSWEWNLRNVWKETWFIEPETGEKKSAWHSAGEFVGRSIDSI